MLSAEHGAFLLALMVNQGDQLSECVHGGRRQTRLGFRRANPIDAWLNSDTDGDLPTILLPAMILRHSSFWSPIAFIHLLFALRVTAQGGNNPFDCHVRTNDLTYDLTPLHGEHTASRTRDTPPSSWIDSVRFDLCADLKPQDGVAAGDQVRSDPNMRFQVALYSLSGLRVVPSGDEGMPDNDEPKGRQLRPCGCRDTSRSIEHTGPKVFPYRP